LTSLVGKLEIGDGASVDALEGCLAELQITSWAPRLWQALEYARRFDFVVARNVLPDIPQTVLADARER